MPAKTKPKRPQRPAQEQRKQPGIESQMRPRPQAIKSDYRASGKLVHVHCYGNATASA